jgi:putative ABC transport system permease protein
MERIGILLSRCAALFRGRALDEELDAEVKAHIEFAIEENLQRGMSAQEARTSALREFGGMTQTKETYRAQRGLPFLATAAMNVRYGLRQLRKSPAFSITAILTLALGIGGMTAVFSVVEAVLLRPLSFKDSGQLLSLHERVEEDTPRDFNVSAPDVLIFQRESKAFSGAGGYVGAAFDVTGAGAPFHATAERVTASLFSVLGVSPLLGRTFTRQEDTNSVPVTVISYALWRERFHGDPGVLGKTIDLDRRPYTIVGVMPRSFEFPLDAGRMSHRDLWVPMSFTPVEKNSEGENYDYGLVGRLKPGVSLRQAQIDVDRVVASIQPRYAAIAKLHLHAYFRTLKEETVRDARPLLNMLLGAAGLILLIACVNLANLLLVRAAGRKREFGVRLALGAARRILLKQLLTESLLLSAIGGVAGIALAAILVRAAAVALPDSLPRLDQIAVRWPMFAAAFGFTGVTGVLCGLAPALAGMRTDILDSLRDGGPGAGRGRPQHRLQSALVTVEIAVAMLLLVASGLLLRSFRKMLDTDPGFQPQHVLAASLSLPRHDYPTQQKVDEFYAELQRKIEAVPGVQLVGFSSNIPIVGQNGGRLITPQGHVRSAGEGFLIASSYLIQGNYFQALHIPLIRGRYFDGRDEQAGAPLTALISQSFAERNFHGRDPIGLQMKVGDKFDSPMPAMTVVGVVGDVKQGALDQPTVDQMYEPVSQGAAALGPWAAMLGVAGNMDVVIRSSEDPALLAPILEKIVHQLDPLLVLSQVHTMDEIVAATESSRRFNTVTISAFAAIALLLSLLGIYGVLSYAVAQRTREIAIRIALGASRNVVLLRTLRYGLALAATGVLGGLIASIGLTHFLKSLLYGVRPLDSPTIGGAVLVLLCCCVVASLWPARRAASIDPMQTLRME